MEQNEATRPRSPSQSRRDTIEAENGNQTGESLY